MTISLENGKTVVINAKSASDKNRYVQALKVNGKPYDKNWVDHVELMKGATLDFAMSDQPNKERGTQAEAFPYSFSAETGR